tara:strand:+ start:19180 stop:19866 length:687 start_codon:yes stop_codon:yes gene_type:complete
MYISEIFYSIQGEGLFSGIPSVFIRTSGCNLRCLWCDSRYTSWEPEGSEYTIEEIVGKTIEFPTRHAVITGGEPLLMKDLAELAESLHTKGYHITIETAGTLYTDLNCDLISISPKLSNSTPWIVENGKYSQNHEKLRINIPVINRFLRNYPYQIKFVVDDKEDLIEIELILNELNNVDRTRVLLMPQGKTIRELNEKGVWVAEACKAQGFRFCPRIHINLYGDTRGT